MFSDRDPNRLEVGENHLPSPSEAGIQVEIVEDDLAKNYLHLISGCTTWPFSKLIDCADSLGYLSSPISEAYFVLHNRVVNKNVVGDSLFLSVAS